MSDIEGTEDDPLVTKPFKFVTGPNTAGRITSIITSVSLPKERTSSLVVSSTSRIVRSAPVPGVKDGILNERKESFLSVLINDLEVWEVRCIDLGSD
ncbi:MAG: hypothetical protein L6R41_002864 [Letrouitia leprolyta]|nr:MAG: hypothetical protein L6R41_002864 [Letrouitia leprolyta]